MMGSRLLTSFALGFAVTAGFAVVPSEEGPLRQKAFRHPDLIYVTVSRPLAELPADIVRQLAPDLSTLEIDPGNAYFDRRTGRWGTVVLTQPLIPGFGKGNSLAWSDLGISPAPDARERKKAAWEAFRGFLVDHVAELRIAPSELAEPRLVSYGERMIQIHVGRQIDGVPVRDTYVTAVVNSGNLVLLGQRNWGRVAATTKPEIASFRAEQVLQGHLGAIAVSGYRRAPWLELVPVSSQLDESLVTVGDGLDHRLVWVLTPRFEGDGGRREALVDAQSGELLLLEDTNRYAARDVGGGVFPVSNDGVPPDGVEQPGYPMPFADIAVDGEAIGFTTTGGNVPPGAETGTISTALSGRYVQMVDQCGPIDESAESGDLDLGDGPGTDCAVPAGHSAGDTHASRSGFYELNRLIEQARGYLPYPWLDRQLTANMNLNASCNAFWNGVSVNFFKSGGGCRNTGEIAAIFDHEWGHGLDNNDANPAISFPGESIADIIAQNRLNDSCNGRGFLLNSTCGGYGDPCTECTGVREADWMKRASQQPHGIGWILDSCPSTGQRGPCFRETHCEGTIVAEAAWDLVHRDLQGFEGSPFDLDPNSALELGTRLSYLGSSNVGNWYQCAADGTGGCNADGGYLGYLATDDDNGDLTDGTPHMSAIFAAFDRHGIACPSPAPQNAGCAEGPVTAPANITATPFHQGVQLTWDPVPGASEYWVFRTEGVHGCAFGKAKVGETTETEFVETGLRNDFEVLYSVVAVGENDACTSPMSTCQAVSPISGPDLSFGAESLVWNEQTGDGDAFLDDCETGTLTFPVHNTGVGALTDVRIVEATVPTHPEVQVLTLFPSTIASSLAESASAEAGVMIRGGGLAHDEVVELEVTVTSDELEPRTFTHTYTLGAVESDLEFRADWTFSFEEGDEGWQVVGGVFDRTDAGGGAGGTSFYRASSNGLNLQCDRVQSPLMQLTETSTLELYNQYDIEPASGGDWWDRANVGVFDPASGERTVVSPDGGREYNAAGGNDAPAPCVSHDPPESPGWAAAGPDWLASTWSAAALGSPDLAGQLVRLDVAYGTDPAATGALGFWFDEVTVTDVLVQVPDGQADACGDLPELTWNPAGLDFGDVVVGATSAPQTVMLENTGEVTASGVAFGTPVNGFAADTDDCGSELAPGETCQIQVTFAPRDFDAVSATLGVTAAEAVGSGLALAGNGIEEIQVFTAMGLEADPSPMLSDGNGVLEPGEFVAVVPAWRNEGVNVHGLSGSATGFTGPPGATYTLVEDEAGYGNVAPGQTGSCDAGGCYEMGLNAPGERPAAHWDATFDETLSEETSRTWTLHIGDSFTDVPRENPFYGAIETLLHSGVTGGCADAAYCPSGSNTRSQMAVFLLRAVEGGEYTPPVCTKNEERFTDVTADNPLCPWIEELADRGVTSGCGGGRYCPGDAVSRAQMAVFLLRALEGEGYTPPACSSEFSDVSCASPFAAWIEELAARQITGGCSATEYCPSDPVSRAQMAVFVTKAFGLMLYGP